MTSISNCDLRSISWRPCRVIPISCVHRHARSSVKINATIALLGTDLGKIKRQATPATRLASSPNQKEALTALLQRSAICSLCRETCLMSVLTVPHRGKRSKDGCDGTDTHECAKISNRKRLRQQEKRSCLHNDLSALACKSPGPANDMGPRERGRLS